MTGSLQDAGELAGCPHHTVAKAVSVGDARRLTDVSAARPQLIDEFLPKLEEWTERRSNGKIRADAAHDKLIALGFSGSERACRRAVARVRTSSSRGGCGCTG